MPDSFITVAPDSTGKNLRTRERTVGGGSRHEQYVIALPDDKVVSFRGRANTFITGGRAGTVGQKLVAIFNAAGSAVLVDVNRIAVDQYSTATKTIASPPPVIRCHRMTVAPTNGTVLGKVPLDTADTSNASVVVTGDVSADRSTTGTALTHTIAANSMLTQEVASRLASFVAPATGSNPYFEPADRVEFFTGTADVTLRAGQGLVVNLDYNVAGSNPATDFWTVTVDWEEYTLP